MRTVTTTIRTSDGEVLPVKTDRPVPKALVFEVMRAIASAIAPADAKIGDVAIASVAGCDANVVITGKKPS
jgi:CxxC motif-containing protein